MGKGSTSHDHEGSQSETLMGDKMDECPQNCRKWHGSRKIATSGTRVQKRELVRRESSGMIAKERAEVIPKSDKKVQVG